MAAAGPPQSLEWSRRSTCRRPQAHPESPAAPQTGCHYTRHLAAAPLSAQRWRAGAQAAGRAAGGGQQALRGLVQALAPLAWEPQVELEQERVLRVVWRGAAVGHLP